MSISMFGQPALIAAKHVGYLLCMVVLVVIGALHVQLDGLIKTDPVVALREEERQTRKGTYWCTLLKKISFFQ